MLYYPFKNYEEFKQMFAIREFDGQKCRQNKILLALYLDKRVLKGYIHFGEIIPSNMEQLATYAIRLMKQPLRNAIYGMELNDSCFRTDKYATDDMRGLCADASTGYIRYINKENDRVFKMRAGKMYRYIVDCSYARSLPEQVRTYIVEKLSSEWIAYAEAHMEESTYKLHVDDNFHDIYTTECCCGNFHSCMMDDEQYTFYEDSVEAKAAYLTDENGDIVARCIIFTDVKDENGDTYRLAERQYSTNGSDDLKRTLVALLIAGGHIDGYKQVGADCHNASAFVANDGTSWRGKSFRIKCTLEDGDTLSYQDSFKWYDYYNNIAYNWKESAPSDCCELDDTDETFTFHETQWSDYEGCDVNPDDCIWIESRDCYVYTEHTVYAENTDRSEVEDDCIYLDGNYYYCGRDREDPESYGIAECAWCECQFVEDEGLYSELTGCWYDCQSCLESAEEEYKRLNWEWSDYDGDYVDDEVISAQFWNDFDKCFIVQSISREAFGNLVDDGEAVEFEGENYVDEITSDGYPVHASLQEVTA